MLGERRFAEAVELTRQRTREATDNAGRRPARDAIGTCCVRVFGGGNGEVVWCKRVDPCRARTTEDAIEIACHSGVLLPYSNNDGSGRETKKQTWWTSARRRSPEDRPPCGPAHRARPSLSPDTPTHITIRVRRHFPDLRRREYYAIICSVLEKYLGRDDFRVVHISIQETHIHFLIEASSKRALTLGMQSLTITLSKRLTGGLGKLFEQRYHEVQIRAPRQARNALAYVLNNWRRHRIDPLGRWPVDPYSSGVTFTGWSMPVSFTVPPEYRPLPVSPARTALLSTDWKQYGLIDPCERPGPLW